MQGKISRGRHADHPYGRDSIGLVTSANLHHPPVQYKMEESGGGKQQCLLIWHKRTENTGENHPLPPGGRIVTEYRTTVAIVIVVCVCSGRKANCILYGVLYGLACVTKVRFVFVCRECSLSLNFCNSIVVDFLGRIRVIRTYMWPDVADGLAWSVGLFVTIMSPANAAELIEMLFGVGPGHHLLP